MLTKLRQRGSAEDGFTLIELLVVILIIGILAAIALPAFLGQQAKGQDSSAKSAARNVVSQMESCFTEGQTYNGCQSKAEVTNITKDYPTGTTVTLGSDPTKSYSVVIKSKSGNAFTLQHSSDTGDVRSCTVTGGTDKGGCQNSSW